MEKFIIDVDKLQEICNFYNLNFAKFAEKIGISANELYAINALKQKEFSRSTLTAILHNCPEVSPYWLITGEGSMLATNIEQGNVTITNGGNNYNHSSANLDALIEMSASQQRTIERLVNLIK